MLVLTRAIGEKILVNNGEIEITLVAIKGDKARIGVQAPAAMPIHREEIQQQIDEEDSRGD